MRRQFLALVPLLLAADAGAQIIRPGWRGREPVAWASFGAALQGTFDVRDGTTGTGVTPSHAFAARTNFTVTLTATGAGGSSSTSKAITCNGKRCS